MEKNISIICDNSLCIACGACAGVCPVSCISLNRNVSGFLRAYIDKNKCLGCKKCLKVCPQMTTKNQEESNKDIGGFIAYAQNPEIRKKGQSGGVVTALLSYLLDKGEVEAAIINKFNSEKHINEAIFVNKSNQLLDGMGSYYSQSDVCNSIYENKEKSLAAVLLGCQSKSVELSEKAGELTNVKYKIGLICEAQYSVLMMKDIVSKTRVELSEVIGFRWKDKQIGKWPGNIKIKTEKKEYILPSKSRTSIKNIYRNLSCSACDDKMNNNADIVCGDPWGIHIEDIKQGYSCVLARTKKGYDLLMKAKEEGYIYLAPHNIRDIIEGQHVDIDYYTEKQKIRNFLMNNNQIQHIYSEEKGKLPLAIKKQLKYEKELYECTTQKSVKKIISKKKRYLKIVELKKIPRKIVDKYNLKKGDK